jgi:hypothetical protein
MTVIQMTLVTGTIVNCIGVLGGLFVSLRNSSKIEQVHQTTNGKMEDLIKEVREASFQKGVKSEQDKTP